ncbi:MAG: hypothetical protein AMJ43_06270 [Coxiella sp. DG_40]|nr:MAG: hypothetical protein AMJ43_06270 [Coxiella sp. DG_40]
MSFISYKQFVRKFYFPLLCKIKREQTLEYLGKLEQSQYLSGEEIKKMQWSRLQRLITHAYENTLYYKRLFNNAELKPDDIKTYEDFLNIPLLSKENVRNHQKEFLDRTHRGKFYKTITSGSEGLSLKLFYDRDFKSWVSAAQWRARRWFGVDIGDKEVAFWGRPLESSFERLVGPYKARMRNIMLISPFDVSKKRLDAHRRKIRGFRPDYMYGYALSIYKLAEYIKQAGKEKKDSFGYKAIFTTSETLFKHQENLIEEAFGCKVAQEYGCAEAGIIAHECPQGNMHITSENLLVEFLKDGQPALPGEFAEVVVTSLNNFYMPLIRYKIGDMGARLDHQCRCRRGLPIMRLDTAKVTSTIITSKGKTFSSELLDYINLELIKKGIKGIRQFRIIQIAPAAFEVEIVKQQPFLPESVDYFRKKMREFFGMDIKIDVKFVEKISRDKSGKIHYFISRIATQQ